MRILKKALILISICVLPMTWLSGQTSSYCCMHLDSVEILPKYPTPNDSILFIVHVVSSNLNTHLGSELTEFPGNGIVFETCYVISNLFIVGHHSDTIHLGKKSMGTYTYNLFLYTSDSFSICSPVDTVYIRDRFTVAGTTSTLTLSEDELSIQCLPNFLSHGSVMVQSNMLLSSIEVLDLMGHKHLSRQNINAKEYHIEMDQLPAQMYIVRAYDQRNHLAIEKVVKQ